MKSILKSILVLGSLTATAGFAAAEEAHVAPVTAFVQEKVIPWLSDPVVIAAIKAQNEKNAGLSQADVDALDQTWRAEVESADKPMIDAVLGNELSKFLQQKQGEAEGTIAEVFVMDAKGLNVGQSDVTSDYWQGDEDKFSKSFGVGKDAIFVDEAEKDESTQALQSQASVTISDESGAPIGAITIGVNLDAL
ncbi:hypothetical protein GVN24_04050 [Rhizobium sp. CRIBSB]|uniref:Uncharacterized protein n=1 Tax=Peteryoungia aggregata LMG 23059 TaxID=1368425 RepID=A0ABU0G6I2_9HYPH|nr:hypothetical protein [Peteryoungia aggregata]MDQ0420949.1 hypothetical protein [Peteryoungia aggregata LMG 23059]NBB47438.1 hypothetical protein [Rhizobium sp. CRIBSB]